MLADLTKKDRRENAHFSKPRKVLVPSKIRFIILSVIIYYYTLSQLLTDTPCHTADNWGSLKPRNGPIFFLFVLPSIRQMPSLERETWSWSLTPHSHPSTYLPPFMTLSLLTPHSSPLSLTLYHLPLTLTTYPSLLLLTPRPRIRPYGNIHSANLLKVKGPPGVKGLFLLYKYTIIIIYM